jgi:hypothetical protein
MKLEIEKEVMSEDAQPLPYAPKTALGEKLLAIRQRILASGAPLLSWEEIEREVTARRGGSENNNR